MLYNRVIAREGDFLLVSFNQVLNLEECRLYLDEVFSISMSDQELLRVRDQMQVIAEVLVEHALSN